MTRRAVVATALAAGACAPSGAAAPLTVFAAISLSDALRALADAGPRPPPRFAFAASSTLARQIEAGAKADVFLSADQAWMDYLGERGLLGVGVPVIVATNRLAVVTPLLPQGRPHTAPLAALAGGRIALADPRHAPAGRYARAALERLNAWTSVRPRMLIAQDVRAALRLVERGEADAGVVYASDAAAARDRVRLVGLLPADSHPPIRYPGAVLRAAQKPAAARDFLALLGSHQGQQALGAAGFTLP